LQHLRARDPTPQDRQVITSIARYFQHPIPEVPHDNEDQFISVLNKAGLTDQTA
jgi:hypothetical protein